MVRSVRMTMSFSLATMSISIDWLMIAYIALFSALLSRLTAFAYEWLAFYSAFFWRSTEVVYLSASMAGATWNCCHLGASSVYTIQPCILSLRAKPHTSGVCVFSCNLPPALSAEWPESFTCYCGNTGVESWPWRRKFSRRSCRDLNPQPFNHESGAQPRSYPRSLMMDGVKE